MIKLKKLIKESLSNKGLDIKVNDLQEDLIHRYPQLLHLSLSLHHDDAIYIQIITIKKEFRGQGYGKKIIKEIKDFADKYDLTIYLSPEPEKGYKEKLSKFYKSHGFVDNKGRKKDYRLSSMFGRTMYRRPMTEILGNWICYWLDKNGKMIEVSDHIQFILDNFDTPFVIGDDGLPVNNDGSVSEEGDVYDFAYSKLKMIRVAVSKVYNEMFYSYNKFYPPNNKQMKELKDFSMENRLELKRDAV
jgi:GNAT superfamily N-acetyltransferase